MKFQDKIIDQIVLINLSISLWTGKKRLIEDDFKVDKSGIPPKTIASLGQIAGFDSDKLTTLSSFKKAAERACQKAGFKFMGGYAIPQDKIQGVVNELEDLSVKFYETKDLLIDEYNDDFEKWVTSEPEWEDVLRRAAIPVERPMKQIHYNYQVYKVTPASISNVQVNKRYDQEMDQIGDRVFEDISKKAGEIWKTLNGEDGSGKQKTKVSHKIMTSVNHIMDKMHTLKFIDGRIAQLMDIVQVNLSLLPDTGSIEGVDFDILKDTIKILMDPDRALSNYSPKSVSVTDSDSMDQQSADLQDQLNLVKPVAPSAPATNNAVVGFW